jgi:hypothetical protein
MTIERSLGALVSIVILVCVGGCDTSGRAVFRNDDSQFVDLVVDSPAVRAVIGEEKRRQESLGSQEGNPADLQDRAAFLRSLNSNSFETIKVTVGTRARILERTSCRCLLYPHVTPVIIKVRVLNGPAKNLEGWTCNFYVSTPPPMP